MTTPPHAVDVRRQAGWLPEKHEDLEAWLDGQRQRVEARGEQIVLHPVITEFRELIDSDPLVRMYLNQMIAQVPTTKPYRERHLESVDQLLRLINDVLTMAPEFGPAMVSTPLGAILDWTMGTPAGFAAYRDPRINAMLKKILTVWSEFLSSGDSLYVLNDSPSGWKSAEATGAVVRAFVQEGTYYSEADSEGTDAVEPMNSQSYLAHVAARAIILIEADDPVIGLMAFVPVGMSEVSSCLIDANVKPGYHVGKGDELGYFQFGGSTHCLLFRPGAIAEFTLPASPQPHDPEG
jgi:hypothetical protein